MPHAHFLHDLTDAQRQAATHVDGPLLIIAAAGSGKTRVITRRVAHLLSVGVRPPSILAITFTNKAASEMKSRVSTLLDCPLRDFGRLDQPWPLICTFHSLGLRILRHYASRLGLNPNFTIFDTADQQRLTKQAIELSNLSTTNYSPVHAHHVISDAKNRLVTVDTFIKTHTTFPGPNHARIYKHYEQLLKQNNALDFDDLLLLTAHAFRDHHDILRELQDRFQQILIDEYQDTNHAQYIVAHALAQRHRNIAVVGDPDQSIYAWRGADIQNILDFEKDYPDAKVIKLEQNYRSTQRILDIASALIQHNSRRKDKRLWTENSVGDPATLYVCDDERDEAQAVARHFEQLGEQGLSYSQMAVFYRINALSRVMEDALRRCGIPYRIARGVDFYHRKEIKDVLSYLRVIANPNDQVSLERIINTPPRGISDNTLRQIQLHALNSNQSLLEALQSADGIASLSPKAKTSIRAFLNLVFRWRSLAFPDSNTPESALNFPVKALLEDVIKSSGYEAYLKKNADEDQSELANVNELLSAAAQFDQENPRASLRDYLAQVALVSDVDTLADNGGAVTLMTLHAAKGLEFPVVAIIGLEDGILPHARVRDHPDQLEEERRLCFVGITRAKQRLILSHAASRTVRGLRERAIPSRFLCELPKQHLQIASSAGYSHFSNEPRSADPGSSTSAPVRPGQFVRHPIFGVGRVVEMSELGSQTRLVVQFDRAGRKTLIAEYARLQPLT